MNIRPRRYRGFYGSGYIGPGDGNGREVKDFCDFTWFHADQSNLVDRIREAASYRLLSVVLVMHTFWHTWWSDEPRLTAWCTLRADAGDRWAALMETLRPVLPHIVAFSQLEEPFHLLQERQLRMRTTAWTAQSEKRALAQQLRDVNDEIHRTTGKAVVGVFSGVELIAGHASAFPARLPDLGYDVVGFNAYSDAGFSDAQYLQLLERLKTTFPSTPLLLFPDAFMGPTDAREAKLARIEKFFALAEQDDRVVALAAYHWGSEGQSIGARDVPWIQERYRRRVA